MTDQQNYLLYDGACPFCANYVRFTRLREAVGPIALLDARRHPDLVGQHVRAGLDVNEGMILRLDGQTYFGGDVVNRLALLSSRSNLFNKMTAEVFRRPALARFLYPALRCGRNLTLKLLGHRQIDTRRAS